MISLWCISSSLGRYTTLHIYFTYVVNSLLSYIQQRRTSEEFIALHQVLLSFSSSLHRPPLCHLPALDAVNSDTLTEYLNCVLTSLNTHVWDVPELLLFLDEHMSKSHMSNIIINRLTTKVYTNDILCTSSSLITILLNHIIKYICIAGICHPAVRASHRSQSDTCRQDERREQWGNWR